jgi:hypothetical protein
MVDIIATDNNPYIIEANGVVISSTHVTLHKAFETALDAAVKCGCDVKIKHAAEFRLTNANTKYKLVHITWAPPTHREDGTPIDNIDRYILEYELNGYKVKFEIRGTEFYFPIPLDADLSIRLAAVDTAGLESKFSESVELVK